MSLLYIAVSVNHCQRYYGKALVDELLLFRLRLLAVLDCVFLSSGVVNDSC